MLFIYIYICILSCGFPSVKYPKRDPQKTRSPTLNPGRGSKRQNTYVNFQPNYYQHVYHVLKYLWDADPSSL